MRRAYDTSAKLRMYCRASGYTPETAPSAIDCRRGYYLFFRSNPCVTVTISPKGMQRTSRLNLIGLAPGTARPKASGTRVMRSFDPSEGPNISGGESDTQ